MIEVTLIDLIVSSVVCSAVTWFMVYQATKKVRTRLRDRLFDMQMENASLINDKRTMIEWAEQGNLQRIKEYKTK